MGKLTVGFLPAVSNRAAKAMRQQLRRRSALHRHDLSLSELADRTRPTLLRWIQYYGRFYRSALGQVLLAVDAALVRWAQRKYKHLRGHKVRATAWVEGHSVPAAELVRALGYGDYGWTIGAG